MDFNLMLYMGGCLFFAGMMVISMKRKQADAGELLIKFKIEIRKMVPTMILLGLAGMLMAMEFPRGTKSQPETFAILLFWLLFAVFQCYLSYRPRVIMEKGIGSCDFFGKIQRDFYLWSDIEKYTVTEKAVVFTVKMPKGLYTYKMEFDPRLKNIVEQTVKAQFKGGKKKK